MTAFFLLPFDILISILEALDTDDLSVLSRTCRAIHALVTEHGWSAFVRTNPRSSASLTQARARWHPRTQAKYDALTDLHWTSCSFVARPLSTKWPAKCQPVMALSPSRLIVGAASCIYSYSFGVANTSPESPPVRFEGQASFHDHQNITALTFIEPDSTLLIAFQDGSIELVQLSPTQSSTLSLTRHKIDPMPRTDFIESFYSVSSSILALSSTGYARLSTLLSDASTTIHLKKRSWSSLLSVSSTPYAAFGTCSSTPLTVHPILQTGLSPNPSAILHTELSVSKSSFDQFSISAVYGLSTPPLNSPWGSSPQIVLSGWYDGQVRMYDLRSSSFSTTTDPTTHAAIPVHRPVLSLVDRWCYEPVYAVASGGGSAAHIAAGTARHSVVSFWDARQPSTGWSVHAPGNDSSPVYSVLMESSRFFGVTQSRPFVYDFGPGVSVDTYPSLPHRPSDNLKRKKGSHRATYHVVSYTHFGTGLCR